MTYIQHHPFFLRHLITIHHLTIYRIQSNTQIFAAASSDTKICDARHKNSPANHRRLGVKNCGLLDLPYEKLKDEILKQNYLQVDETHSPVLDKGKEGAPHQGYYSVYHSPKKKLVLFDYHEGRRKTGPAHVLQNYGGILQTDSYAAYQTLDKQRITLFHCMANTCRYFEQALDNYKERSQYALTQIQKLYDVKEFARPLTTLWNDGQTLTLRY